jgi:signal transduction histidine kinase
VSSRARSLRRHTVRTAAIAAALVGVGVAAVLTATDLLVSHNLTAAVDQRLVQRISEAARRPTVTIPEAAPDSDFDEPLLTWVTPRNGRCQPVGGAPSLPSSLCSVSSPTNADISGTAFRLTGAQMAGGEYLVVAASLAPAAHQMGILILAELIVGPCLVVFVFFGALGIGRRVGGPVERMRQRQLAFTADASHELRTPLTVIQAETSLALAGDDDDLRSALGRIGEESGRMRRIIEDLLWLARFDSEPEPPVHGSVDLSTVIGVATQRFAAVAAARGLTITVQSSNVQALVSAPVEWLDRLMGVLLDNACRHARSQVTIRLRITHGRYAELLVSDDGEGIPATELSRIFERFHRGTTMGQGAGLGLAIADSVVNATEGRWEIVSTPSQGAHFGVVWPPAPGARSSAGQPGQQIERTVPRKQRLHGDRSAPGGSG